MEGELDFAASLQARVATLAGLPESELDDVARTLPLMEGAERLFATLRKPGYRTAILSGGFQYFGDTLKTRLGVDYVFANRLEIENGALTGEVTRRLWMRIAKRCCYGRLPSARVSPCSR